MGGATTLMNIVQRIGGALGAIAVGVLTQTGASYRWAFAGLLIIALLKVLPTLAIASRREAMMRS